MKLLQVSRHVKCMMNAHLSTLKIGIDVLFVCVSVCGADFTNKYIHGIMYTGKYSPPFNFCPSKFALVSGLI